MTIEELEAWQEAFEQFHARFADLFERSESREQAKKYLRGLLAQADRKNSWQVAEAVGDRIPDRMQRLLYRVPWDAEAARDRLQQFVIEKFSDQEGIGVVDETSFLKKGTHSVGVARKSPGSSRQAREWAGRDRVELCQSARARVSGSSALLARRGMGLGSSTTVEGTHPRRRGVRNQTGAGKGDAPSCLGARRADAMGHRR